MKNESNNKPMIYGLINLINNKIYIGKSINFKIRKKAHENSFIRKEAVNVHLQRAIDKYGIHNFKFIILEEVSMNNIDEREKFWINKHQSYDEKFGYNKTMGGDGGNLTIETKLKISKTSPHRKVVYQFDKEGNLLKKWDGMRDIERKKGYLSSTISKACSKKSKNKSAYGFLWSFENKITDNKGLGQENRMLKIKQIDLNGNLIKEWNSISEAALKTNSSKSSIIKCCKGKQKTCNNFKWNYC